MDSLPPILTTYLTGEFAFSAELQTFWMAIQGSMAVRNGANRNRDMHWFHAYMLSVLTSYAGAIFTFLWIGRPTSVLANDLNLGASVLAFIIVNYLPFDIGYHLGNTLPIKIITTMFAQLFRALGLVKFTTMAFELFKDSPSAYYPIPVFGPIVFGTILGNMGGFFHKGFHGYLRNGIPWPFQSGLFCGTFYHFYIHDKTGPVGLYLRQAVDSFMWVKGGLDDKTFAIVLISGFQHVVAILQLPDFLGPSFGPFNWMAIPSRRGNVSSGSSKKEKES